MCPSTEGVNLSILKKYRHGSHNWIDVYTFAMSLFLSSCTLGTILACVVLVRFTKLVMKYSRAVTSSLYMSKKLTKEIDGKKIYVQHVTSPYYPFHYWGAFSHIFCLLFIDSVQLQKLTWGIRIVVSDQVISHLRGL